jgi:ATP-binding cassette, subfamily B, bacterial
MFSLLRPYRAALALLVLFGFLGNGVNLVLPWLIGAGVNSYSAQQRLPDELPWQFVCAAVAVLLLTTLQSVVQIATSERVARELRDRVADRISRQSWSFVLQQQPGRLLTNLTSDVDSVKVFVAQAIPSLLSSLVLLLGSSVLLLLVNWRLGLAVLVVVPAIGLTFFGVLRRVRPLFRKARDIVDQINTRVQQNVVGAALVRVLNANRPEQQRFAEVNRQALDLGLTIVANFSIAIPLVTFFANAVNVVILGLGGRFVIGGHMTVGELATFNGYLALLIFPIFVLGFMGNVIAQSQAAYARLETLLEASEPEPGGTLQDPLRGHVEMRDVTLRYGEKSVLKDVSLELPAGTRTALIGPTAAGKSQLLYLLTGLLPASEGEILFDGQPLAAYDPAALRRCVTAVFQESILFHLSLRENIAFSQTVTPAALQLAVETAELNDFVRELPQGLETVVSERGTSLSGGQKQRVMLARALALQPTVLLLDDFTARVDAATEARIASNLRRNYPDLTLLTITQRIAPVQDYERIVLLMEGRVLGSGTHAELLQTCPEYVQIYESQKSTHV